MKRHLLVMGAVCALVLIPVGQSAARPQTTAPQTTAPPQVWTIKITITDSAIRMSPKSAPRGDMGRFILVNAGKKRHAFSLGHLRHQTGSQTGFARTLNPGQQSILLLFLDYRGTLPYLATLPADRLKPAMKGTFKIF